MLIVLRNRIDYNGTSWKLVKGEKVLNKPSGMVDIVDEYKLRYLTTSHNFVAGGLIVDSEGVEDRFIDKKVMKELKAMGINLDKLEQIGIPEVKNVKQSTKQADDESAKQAVKATANKTKGGIKK